MTRPPWQIGNKGLRRRKRALENDFYAATAQAWSGKIKSADRLAYDKPADTQAAKELKGYRYRKKTALD